jgi:hypothetical protein
VRAHGGVGGSDRREGGLGFEDLNFECVRRCAQWDGNGDE